MFLGISSFQRGILFFRSKYKICINTHSIITNQCIFCVDIFLDISKISAMSQYHTLKIEKSKEFVFSVQINRPEKANAMNKTMWL